MAAELIRRIFLATVLIALQVLVCNHIHLLGIATPMLYVLFLVRLPINSGRIGNMLWAFMIGLIIDIFSSTPGEATGALVAAAFVQWPLLHLIAPKDCLDDMAPSFKTMGKWNHVRYVFILTLVHHTVFFLFEFYSFSHVASVLISLGSSVVLSFVLMLTLESLRHGK